MSKIIKTSFFTKFKNIHSGKSSILFGGGPTFNLIDLEKIKDELILVGTNRHIFLKELNLDYYFCGDAHSVDDLFFKQIEKKKVKLNKFIGIRDSNKALCFLEKFGKIPQSENLLAYEVNRSKRKHIKLSGYNSEHLHCDSIIKDIDVHKMTRRSSITFEALQFILYSGVRKIYLVGHDCSYQKGSFHDKNFNISMHSHYKNKPLPKLLNCWQHSKSFIEKNYPKVEIFNINPIGLKGLFEEKSIDVLYK